MNNSDDALLANADESEVAIIGHDTETQTPVPLQLLQSIYHELTGKTESLSKHYDEPFKFEFNDLEQLNHRLNQACEQYNINTSNMSVTVYYTNDTQETFSSFDRFRGFNAGNASPVESVLLTYNFLILLPKVKAPQSYKVTIRLVSRTTISRKMAKNEYFDFPKILHIMGPHTGNVTIKYIDYAVGRNILHTIDEWFKTVSKSRTSKFWKLLSKRSEVMPYIARYFTGAVVAGIIFASTPYLLSDRSTPVQLAEFLFAALVGLFSSYKLASHLGRGAERSIDRWEELSYISLTAGDKLEIDAVKASNVYTLIFASIKFILGLLVSLAAKIIIALLIGK